MVNSVFNIGTVSGFFVFYREGVEDWREYFSITMQDNCCSGHAKSGIKQMVQMYAKSIQKDEDDPCFSVEVEYHDKD